MTVKELRERLHDFNDSDIIAIARHSDFTDDVRLNVSILVRRKDYLERYFPEQYKLGTNFRAGETLSPKTVQCLVID